MTINFVGLFGTTGSGELSDESHLANALQTLGHTVRRIPRDEWREYVIEHYPEGKYRGVPADLHADINIIAKWHHFYDGSFINDLHNLSHAPVFYWVWDSVDLNIDWHRKMAQAADLYLSGELGRAHEFRQHNIRFYYFQMDVVDTDTPYIQSARLDSSFLHDVVYLGTYDNQNGRMDILKAINKEIPIAVYGQNYEEWQRQGFTAYPAVYGIEANNVMARSKIVLGTSCDPHLFGYWSNRVGRVLSNRSLLLQQYTPGMENFLHDWVEYYSTPQEAIEKIKHLLKTRDYRNRQIYDRELWKGSRKAMDLCILIERYLKENNGKEWLLP